MAIFDDPKKELEQLEKQLIAEEEWFRQELDSAKLMLGDKPAPKKKPAPKAAPAQGSAQVRNYANGYDSAPKPGAKSEAPKKSAPQKSAPQKSASKKAAPPAEKPRSNKGLIILAVCETLGIVGVVAYWLLFIFG